MSGVQSFKRTRLAPTPSGFLHIGNIASFLFTAGLARKFNASILLRIDDLDQQRVRKEYIDDIFDTLHFLEIPWDEGPRNTNDFIENFSQLHRMPIYERHLKHLEQTDQVFACLCSRNQLIIHNDQLIYPATCLNKNLPFSTPDSALRLKTDKNKLYSVRQLDSSYKNFSIPSALEYVPVRKKDGQPSYQLSSVADDIFFEVDLVVRGADLLPSSIVQHCIAEKLQHDHFSKIAFIHHPLVQSQEGVKLSKSAGSTSIDYLRKKGNSRQQILSQISNFCGLSIAPENWQELYNELEKTWIK